MITMTLTETLEKKRQRQGIQDRTEAEAKRLAAESTSLNAQTQGRGLAVSWLRDRTALPEGAYVLTPGERRRLGRNNGYFNAPSHRYDQDEFYQAGWREGLADREKAMALGVVPKDKDGRPMKYWSEFDSTSHVKAKDAAALF